VTARKTSAIAAGVAVLALALPHPAAAATRAEFATAADAICKQQTVLQLRAERRARKREGRPRGVKGFLRADARHARGSARAIDHSVRLIAQLPVAPGDEMIVAQWLDSLRWDAANARFVARAATRKRFSFRSFFAAISQTSAHRRATDLLVDGFGMRECAADTHYSSAVSAGRLP
jgi:hypothetical protein